MKTNIFSLFSFFSFLGMLVSGLLCALPVLASPIVTNSVVVPNYLTDRFGGGGRQLSAIAVETTQVYHTSSFGPAELDRIWVTGLALRWGQRSASLSTVIPALEIHMSTFPGQFRDLQSGRGNNWGPDRRMVYSVRNLPVTASRPESPSEFGIEFIFQDPFLYDRNAGQLVVDLGVFGPIRSGAEIDFEFEFGAPDSRWITDEARGVYSGGHATKFFYTPIPEPASGWLFLSGAMVVICLSRRLTK